MTTPNTLSSDTVKIMQAYERYLASEGDVEVVGVSLSIDHVISIVSHGKTIPIKVRVVAHKATHRNACQRDTDRFYVCLLGDTTKAIGSQFEVSIPEIHASPVFELTLKALQSRGIEAEIDADKAHGVCSVIELPYTYAQAFVDAYIDQGIKAGLIREKGALG